jgi:glycosyltransferase involved in cell wall biosynthesis
MKKKILIDLQCLQTESAHRGIGRYTYNLTINILQQNTEYDIHILLNSALPNILKVRQQFTPFIKNSCFHIFTPITPCSSIDPSNWQNMKASEYMYEVFVANLNPDLLFLPSLMEGGVHDDLVASVSKYFNVTTVVIGYDLIPLHYESHYLASDIIRRHYFNKLQHKSNADMILGISEYVTHDIEAYLNHLNCINISCAVNEYFTKINYSDEDLITMRSKLSIESKYIMYTGGIDFRKNIEGLICQFSLLPKEILDNYSLVIVCKISDLDRKRLIALAETYKIKANLIITGYVDDQDLHKLYSFCSLFVFPSLDEGFGLPVLEAMNCGAVIACANNSSLPEVVGSPDVLFDTNDNFYHKIYELLINNDLRQSFLKHSQLHVQKFSWWKTANGVINAFNNVLINARSITKKKTLAMVSPFPPQHSGIADYSMELIQYLSKYYRITIVYDEPPLFDNVGYFNSINYTDFELTYEQFDRVVYQMGNSHFHSKMYSLMNRLPGVLVLHDFYIGHFVNHYFIQQSVPPLNLIKKAIDDHGYEILKFLDSYQFLNKFPLNADIIKSSFGVIVHSNYALKKLIEYYPNINCSVIKHMPLLRKKQYFKSHDDINKGNMFTVVSMGGINKFKGILEIIDAISSLDNSLKNNLCMVFVGDKGDPDYFSTIEKSVKAHNLQNIIQFTHRVNSDEYFNYLSSADIAIQLRLNSMGETSASVLDCMNVGIPVIVNNHGSVGDLPSDVVYKISENFSVQELADSIIKLINDYSMRKNLSLKSTNYVAEVLSPTLISALCYKHIEEFYSHSFNVSILNELKNFQNDPLLSALAFTQNFNVTLKEIIYVDISELVVRDWQSGIQRVVKIILYNLLKLERFRIEPIYFSSGKCFRATNYMIKLFVQNHDHHLSLSDEELHCFASNSLFLGLDLHYEFVNNNEGYEWLKLQRSRGVKFVQVIYDLILINNPQYFPKFDLFHKYINRVMSLFDGVIAISKVVADDYLEYYKSSSVKSRQSVGFFHLGCDIDQYNSHHVTDAVEDLSMLVNKKYMLMVSTIEPRKGHAQVLEAFEKLWLEDSEYCLALVGKQGWNVDELVHKITNHSMLNKKLFWLQGISDEALNKVYENSSAFIMASFAEGFGLGIVESAKYHKPLILRDIPIFREIAGDNAYYFDCLTGDDLALELRSWIRLYECGNEPKSDKLKTITWEESCQQLMDVVLNNKWYKTLSNV